jgi:molybdopterin molybdotransferase
MISVKEALSAIESAIQPTPAVNTRLEEAAGRRLAEPVLANLTQPPFSASAMDGYACQAACASSHESLLVIGVSSAGERFNGAIGAGEAVRIFTGAPVPDGADCVIIQENVSRGGERITLRSAPKVGDNIRKAGIDFHEGDELFPPGKLLDGPALALAAAANVVALPLRRRPRVALIANGDELVMPGAPRSQDQIICSVPLGLSPLIRKWGGEADFLGIAPDDPKEIRRIVEHALDFDLIIPIGGASVGEKDFMRSAFRELGFVLGFEKVAVRPGKPTWFGALKQTCVLGLPGNPASALVTATLFARAAIDRFLGAPIADNHVFRKAKFASPVQKNGARESYLRAVASVDANGETVIAPHASQDSSLLSTFAASNALLRRAPNAPEALAGELTEYLAL